MGALGFCFVLASLGFVLAAITAWNLSRIRGLLRSHSVRSAVELSAQIAALASSLESLSKTTKRLSSRQGMEAKRGLNGRAQAAGISELQGEDWKRAARQQFIKPGQPAQHGEH